MPALHHKAPPPLPPSPPLPMPSLMCCRCEWRRACSSGSEHKGSGSSSRSAAALQSYAAAAGAALTRWFCATGTHAFVPLCMRTSGASSSSSSSAARTSDSCKGIADATSRRLVQRHVPPPDSHHSFPPKCMCSSSRRWAFGPRLFCSLRTFRLLPRARARADVSHTQSNVTSYDVVVCFLQLQQHP
eukprot:TRINITY_DN3229_c0_g2_i1.p1 TRINITY_DN3229_c0_g2~~TRINITY_DN3229_c0_g2_i1.p1  ORF type:complete len:187 (-),score=44.93 TRINITY_DN3229_c0_g2_i1:338-898(-)